MSIKKEISIYLKEKAGGYKPFLIQKKANGTNRIHFYNWWTRNDGYKFWLEDFVLKRILPENNKQSISIGSVFGSRKVLAWPESDVRIFFSGENLHIDRWAEYSDYMLSGSTPYDLGLGFDCFDDDHYLRFPLWLTYLFSPEANEEEIISTCKQLRHPSGNSGNKFCSMISRWDPLGTRAQITNQLSSIAPVDCPSNFMHNDDSLINVFKDNKCEYLKQYKFNICPENSNAFGYTTEKIFECIKSGCIPIYWGSYFNPEPDVINPDAVLFWDMFGNNDATIAIIRELNSNIDKYQAFASMPRLKEGAEEWIIDRFQQLEDKIKQYVHE